MTIYCVGRNYALHAKELNNEVPDTPVIFLKADSSIRNFEDSKLAFENETFHFEGEIVLHIEKDHDLNESYSSSSIRYFSFGIDLTRREEQSKLKEKGLPWTTSKSFYGSSIIGRKYNADFLSDNFVFKFYVNDELKQTGKVSDMLFSFKEIITYLNSFSPLKKGDLIFTGTPAGVGEIKRGSSFTFINDENNLKEAGTL